MLYQLYNIKLSHVILLLTGARNSPLSLTLVSMMNFNSDEWHVDETVVKINGKKHHVCFIIDSETHFVLGFRLSPYRSFSHWLIPYLAMLNRATPLLLSATVTVLSRCQLSAIFLALNIFEWRVSKTILAINLIESFNNLFKAWYKTKRGFHSFESTNATISVFVFFFNFIRSPQSLNSLTPTQVSDASYNPNPQNLFSLAKP